MSATRRRAQKGSRVGRQLGGWVLGSSLGSGGNGQVFRATKGQQTAAVKVLRVQGSIAARVTRFRDEVEAMRRCADIVGVLPVLDDDLSTSSRSPWFAMGLATPLTKHLGSAPSLLKVVEAVRDIGHTLELMHARDISHRDVKPENLFYFKGRCAVGDFGLADYEGKSTQTAKGERIGPLLYIAPEMLNDSTRSDGRPADVFSLAKVLWVLATGQRYPIPGSFDAAHETFRIGAYIQGERTGHLDKLIAAATALLPEHRPSMQHFVGELSAWLSPPPSSPAPIQIDTAAFSAALASRREAMSAERLRSGERTRLAREVGHRVREHLRPLANDLEASLNAANFDSVSKNVDRYEWGFEVQASVPDGNGRFTQIDIRMQIDPNDLPKIAAWCRVYLKQVRGGVQIDLMLWDKRIEFLEGGSQEERELSLLEMSVRQQLQGAVDTVLNWAFTEAQPRDVGPHRYELHVSGPTGPAVDCDVLFVGPDGTYARTSTDRSGVASVGNWPWAETAVLIAHQHYMSAFVPRLANGMTVELQADDTASSAICTQGWTSLPGLLGKVTFIRDGQNRTYVYAENVAINGGQAQPVDVSLGHPTSFAGADGSGVSVTPRAILGPCFLLDLKRL